MTSCQQLANASALTGPLLRAFVALCMFSSASAFATQIQGQVQGANAPIGGATVTLWAASADAPRQLAQTQSDAGGRFTLSADGNGVDLIWSRRVDVSTSALSDGAAITEFDVLPGSASRLL
jgi:hypothetical protein